MKHISHYKERILYSTFIVLFVISALLLLTDIDSFTAMLSMQTAQIAESCEKTISSARACTNGLYGYCENSFSKQYFLNQKGDAMCCCLPVRID